MKIVKKLLKFVLWIVGIAVVLVLALPLWVGPVVKTTANAIVPKKTGTAFNLGRFVLNPYCGKLSVGDVQLWNPDGFDQKMAVTLGTFGVEVDMASVAGDPIVVKDIVLQDVFVSYLVNARGENNITIIQRNAAGDGEKADDVGEKTKPAAPAKKPADDEKPAKKIIIDHLLVRNVLVQLGPIPMPMPDVELSGIGRKSNGVTMEEAWNQIYAQVMKNFDALNVNLNDLAGSLGDAGLDRALKTIDASKNVDVKGMSDAFKGGAGVVGDATGKTTDAVKESAEKTIDAVGEQTDKAVNALKGLFK